MFLTAISTIVMLKTHMHNRLQFGFTRYTRKILSVNCKTLCCPIGLHTGRSSKPANSPKFFVMFYIWLLSTISQMLRPVLQKSKFCSQESFFFKVFEDGVARKSTCFKQVYSVYYSLLFQVFH